MNKQEFSYTITKNIGVIPDPHDNLQLEVNLMKWGNAKEDKLDVRTWRTQTKGAEARIAYKGCTMDIEQARQLKDILTAYFDEIDSQNN